MLISGTISSLINGVSQQSPPQRLASQGEIQENGYSSVTDGLMKRYPTEHIAKLTSNTYANVFVHWINRSETERYVIIIDADSNITGFDLVSGDALSITNSAADSYLTSDDPIHDFAALTIEDTTVIVNRTITTANDAFTLSGGITGDALVWVRQANYDTTYNIDLNGTTATFTTKHSTASNADDDIQTIHIATELVSSLGSPSGFTITQNGSVIWIKKDDGTPFSISVSDTISNTGLALAYQTIQDFSSLPSTAPNGMVITVSGDVTSNADNYYVQFTCTNSGDTFGPGTWSETIVPNIEVQVDATTMPHSLVRNDDGTFTYDRIDWTQRLVGDLDTTPDPSFVGHTIYNVFLFQERLGFLSDTNVVMSRTNDLYNFYRGTVLSVLSSDPIDVSAADARVLSLRHAVPFNQALLLFADDTQLTLASSNGALSPQTVSIIPQTGYNADRYASPVLIGNMVYFPYPNGSWAGVREMYVMTDTGQNEADNITAIVPHYITGDILKMSATSIENVLVAQAAGDTDGLYVYKFEWNGNQKIQSSWSHWSFSTDVLSMEFMGSDLYLLMQACDGVYLEIMHIEAGRVDEGTNFLTHLDRRISSSDCTITYDQNTNTSTIILPYDLCGAPVGGGGPVTGPIGITPPLPPPLPVYIDIGVQQGFYTFFGDLDWKGTGSDPMPGGDPRFHSDYAGDDIGGSGATYAITGEPGNWTLTVVDGTTTQVFTSIADIPLGDDSRAGLSGRVIWQDKSLTISSGGTFYNGFWAAGTYLPPYTASPPPYQISTSDVKPVKMTGNTPGDPTADGPVLSGTVLLKWPPTRNAAAYEIKVHDVDTGEVVVDSIIPAPAQSAYVALSPGRYYWTIETLTISSYLHIFSEDHGDASDNLYFQIA